MTIERELVRVITLPPPSPGQFGPDHQVVEVIKPDEWTTNDPFILLMDDRLNGKLEAGPHPHVGFETVTFPVMGGGISEGGAGHLAPGDVEWTTAGKGIIHGPDQTIEGQFRILQLWLTLPKKERWTEPDHQLIRLADAPVRREPGVEVRLYSGTTGELRSSTRNHVPVTLVDIHAEPGASFEQELPLSYNAFLYVLEGEARIGSNRTPLRVGQVGWIDLHDGDGGSTLRIAQSGRGNLRVLLYAGQRQSIPIVSYGPFVGDTKQDITRAFEGYRAGTFKKY